METFMFSLTVTVIRCHKSGQWRECPAHQGSPEVVTGAVVTAVLGHLAVVGGPGAGARLRGWQWGVTEQAVGAGGQRGL